jgi:hypothetical protein
MHSSNTHSWRINPVLPVAKLVGAVALAGLAWAFGRHDPVQWVLAGVVVLGLLGWALRDGIAPVRLAASPDGLTVLSGFAGRRHLAWSAIERIRVDRRERRGLRTELLEIDAGDSLHLFSIHDLGTPPQEVAALLEGLRSADRSAGQGH